MVSDDKLETEHHAVNDEKSLEDKLLDSSVWFEVTIAAHFVFAESPTKHESWRRRKSS